MAVWEKRIVGSGDESPTTLRANPRNWRRHPADQHDALREILDQVGWVQQVVVNQRTGHLVDGHLRVELAESRNEDSVPVLYVDLEPDEERLVLAALDPIAALAQADTQALAQLLDGLAMGDALSAMLADLAPVVVEQIDRGDALDSLDVSIDEPQHEASTGETWALGDHVLYVGSVHRDWPQWSQHLRAGTTFAPYPTPMLAVLYTDGPLVMVQPDVYLAGHVLDKWASRHGEPTLL